MPGTSKTAGDGKSSTRAGKIAAIVLGAVLILGLGLVIGRSGVSTPAAPAAAPRGESAAAAPMTWTMPNYSGWTMAAATSDLARTGRTFNLTALQGVMLVGSQTPPAGTTLYSDTYVTLYPTQPQATYTAPPSEPAAINPSAITAGTYEVGADLQPGTYKTAGSSWCYWERLRGNSGEFKDIIANGNESGRASVKVAGSDKFVKFSGTCTWSKTG